MYIYFYIILAIANKTYTGSYTEHWTENTSERETTVSTTAETMTNYTYIVVVENTTETAKEIYKESSDESKKQKQMSDEENLKPVVLHVEPAGKSSQDGDPSTASTLSVSSVFISSAVCLVLVIKLAIFSD